jgi:cyclohexadienyl dehydratase
MKIQLPIDLVRAAVRLILVGAALSPIDFAQAAPSALEVIRTRGVLLVGTTGDYSPFSRRTRSGELAGADIDMARSLAATIGSQA